MSTTLVKLKVDLISGKLPPYIYTWITAQFSGAIEIL